MPREAEPSVNERTFLLQALQENIRLDGRAFDAYRQLDVLFGEEYGVADVRLGKTRYGGCRAQCFPLRFKLTCHHDRVLTRISASIIAPYPDRKFDGVFTITTELSPLASPAFEVGR